RGALPARGARPRRPDRGGPDELAARAHRLHPDRPLHREPGRERLAGSVTGRRRGAYIRVRRAALALPGGRRQRARGGSRPPGSHLRGRRHHEGHGERARTLAGEGGARSPRGLGDRHTLGPRRSAVRAKAPTRSPRWRPCCIQGIPSGSWSLTTTDRRPTPSLAFSASLAIGSRRRTTARARSTVSTPILPTW